MRNCKWKYNLIWLIVLFAVPGWGATYYLDASAPDDSGTGLTYDSPKKTRLAIRNLGNATAGPHTVYVAPGTYDEFTQFTDSDWEGGNWIGVQDLQTLTPATQSNPGVTCPLFVSSSNHIIQTNNPTVTHTRIFFGADGGGTYSQLYVNGGATFITETCWGSSNAGSRQLYANNGTLILNRSDFQATTGNCLQTAGSGDITLNYTKIRPSLVSEPTGSYTAYHGSTGAFNINNSYIGSRTTALHVVSGTANVKNSILSAGYDSSSYAVRRAGGTVNLEYNILIAHFSTGNTTLGTIATDTGNIRTSHAFFTKAGKPGIITISVDDYNSQSSGEFLFEVEDALVARQLRGSAATVVRTAIRETDKPLLQAMINRLNQTGYGMALVNHSWSHANLTSDGPYQMSGPNAASEVEVTADTVYLSNTTGSRDYSFSWTSASTLTDFNNWWTTENPSGWTKDQFLTVYGGTLISGLQQTTTVVGTSLTYVPWLKDTSGASGFFYNEIAYAESVLQANFTGYGSDVFVTPYGSADADVRAATLNIGYDAMRGDSSTLDETGYSMTKIYPYKLSNFGYTMIAAQSVEVEGTADNGGEIQIQATGHGFTTGDSVTIKQVYGTTEANGSWTITVDDADNLTLNGSVYQNAYVSGGYVADNDTTLTIQRARAIGHAVSQFGLCFNLVLHQEDGIDISLVEAFLDTIISEFPEITITDLDTALDMIQANGTVADAGTTDESWSRSWTDVNVGRVSSGSEGAIVTGLHDQSTLVTDYFNNTIYFTPSIGIHEPQGDTITIETDDYAPTGYAIRKGATLKYKGSGHLDLSGLSDSTGVITVKLKSIINQFTPNHSTDTIEGSGGGASPLYLGK